MPPEVVFIGRQRLTGKVSEIVKGCIGAIMTMEPGKRKEYIANEIKMVFGDNDVLKTLGIDLDKEFMKCKGEVIAPPTVKYQSRSASISNGKWNMANCKFNDGKRVVVYGLVNFAGANVGPQILDFFTRLAAQAGDLGMRFEKKEPVWKRACNSEDDIPSIRQTILQQLKDGKKLDVLFVVLKEKSTRVYKPLKEALDGLVITQCVVARNTPIINNKDRGIEGHIANILCKVNMKLGGSNQILDHERTVDGALKELVGTDGSCCVVGVDLNHPSAAAAPRGQDRKAMPSFAAMVASLDNDMCKFTHTARAQKGGADVISRGDIGDMFKMMMERRAAFRGSSGGWPKRLIYLRDGANEEALQTLIEQELDAIRAAYKSASQPVPQTLAIVVKKRHQTRFFPKNPISDSQNMPPGTLLMDNLSLPLQYDNFYLLSHAGLKGTSHPCRYVVVEDDFAKSIPSVSKMNKGERMKKYAHLMYQMCHLYGRCQKSVSVPAPIFYAHLLADRSRIHADPICRKMLGMSVLDSASELSGGDLTERKPLGDSEIDRFLKELNATLENVSKNANMFFFC